MPPGTVLSGEGWIPNLARKKNRIYIYLAIPQVNGRFSCLVSPINCHLQDYQIHVLKQTDYCLYDIGITT